MRKPLITLLLFLGASAQTLLPGPVFSGATEWPVLPAMILCIALRSERANALYAGVLAGFLHDAFSPAPLGVSIPFFIFIAWGVSKVRNEIFSDQIISYAILGFLTALLQILYFSVLFALTGLRSFDAGSLMLRLFAGSLLGAFTAPLLSLLFSIRSSRSASGNRWMTP